MAKTAEQKVQDVTRVLEDAATAYNLVPHNDTMALAALMAYTLDRIEQEMEFDG